MAGRGQDYRPANASTAAATTTSLPTTSFSQDQHSSSIAHSNNNNSINNKSSTDANPDDQPCRACDAFPARFQCSACEKVRYCSQECQADDWRYHHRECVTLALDGANEDNDSAQGQGEASMAVEGQGLSADAATGTPRSLAGPGVSGASGSHRRTGDTTDDPLGSEAENVRATANRPRRRPAEPRRRPRLTPEQIAAYEEAERVADMKFYMLQVYKIIKPVVVCICLSILWVKISMAGNSDYRPTQSSYTVYTPTADSTVSQNIVGSLANAGIIIGQIVIVTIIIVALFKRGYIKVLIGFFMIVVALLLGFMGYILILNLIQVLRIPLDYATMCFALWNFAVVGLISVFWRGPMWLQQTYLTIMSSLMAFSLTGLQEWTTWMLLGLLVIWDLVAVLCPFGPLKVLVESSRSQNQEVPALLYTVNAVWFMASPPDSILNQPQGASSAGEGAHERHPHVKEDAADSIASRNSNGDVGISSGAQLAGLSRNSSTMALVDPIQNEMIELGERSRSGNRNRDGNNTNQTNAGARARQERPADSRRDRENEAREGGEEEEEVEEEEDDDDEGGGLKLGLGDFVFYSVLIARAAMFDWVTTLCCTVAVLTGMNATIFLLAIYKKALPALPISICFGMLFYFATRYALVPFLDVLGPAQVFI